MFCRVRRFRGVDGFRALGFGVQGPLADRVEGLGFRVWVSRAFVCGDFRDGDPNSSFAHYDYETPTIDWSSCSKDDGARD